jgi:hypothetical protein
MENLFGNLLRKGGFKKFLGSARIYKFRHFVGISLKRR